MESVNLTPSPSIAAPQSLADQVILDLETSLKTFKDPKKGLRILSQKMGIHEKTLRRLLMSAHAPSYITLYKIYRVLTGANNDTELLDKVPALVREQIIKGNPKKPKEGVQFRSDLQKELLSDRAAGEIYFTAACGGIRRDEVIFRYGQFGLGSLQRLLQLNLLNESSPHFYVLGRNQLNFDAETIKRLGLHMVESFASPSATDTPKENFLAVFAEGLSEETYKQWVEIDKEAYYKKVALTKEPGALGSVRAYTFISTDKIRINDEVL